MKSNRSRAKNNKTLCTDLIKVMLIYIYISYARSFELSCDASRGGLIQADVSCGNAGGKGDLAAAGQDVREGEGVSSAGLRGGCCSRGAARLPPVSSGGHCIPTPGPDHCGLTWIAICM